MMSAINVKNICWRQQYVQRGENWMEKEFYGRMIKKKEIDVAVHRSTEESIGKRNN